MKTIVDQDTRDAAPVQGAVARILGLLGRGSARAMRQKEFGAIVALLVTGGVFAAWSPYFLTGDTLSNAATVTAEYGFLAVGVTMLMIAGEFDLTTGVMFALVPMLMAHLYVVSHWPVELAFLTALLAAAGCGLLNGILTVKFRIPSFITTLGMSFFWKGLLVGLTAGYPIALSGREPRLLRYMGGSVWSAANALYYPAIWYLVVVVVFVYILEFTSWGNYIFATGSNALAAKALGVPVGRVKIGCFMLSSVLAGLAGCMILGYQSSADPSQGTDFEMFAIVAAVVGGTSLFGGSGSIAGSVIGSMIIAISGSGLVLVGAPAAWYQAFVGVILILAVIVNLRTSGLEASSLIRLIKGSPLTRRRTETAAPQ